MLKHVLAVLMTSFAAATASASGPFISFTTEDYEPFHFEENGEIVGSGTDQVREIMQRAGLDFDITIMLFSRAITLAERNANTCVFTTAHTAERGPRFHWVEPLFVDVAMLVRRPDADFASDTLDEALRRRIGTPIDDYTVTVLEELGATNIHQAPQIDNAMTMLANGRLDYVAMSSVTYQESLAAGAKVESTLVLREDVFSIACSRTVPLDTIKAMQTALDSMIEDGTQARIVASYSE